MNDEITGIFAILFGFFIFFRRKYFTQLFITQQNYVRNFKPGFIFKIQASEQYLARVVLFMSLFCIVVGILTLLGILHAA